MEVLSEDMIRQWILPALPFSAHGRPSVVEPVELVEAILYKLKSGCQCHQRRSNSFLRAHP